MELGMGLEAGTVAVRLERGVARRTILIVNSDGSGEPTALNGLWTSVSWSPDGDSLLALGFPYDGHEGQVDL